MKFRRISNLKMYYILQTSTFAGGELSKTLPKTTLNGDQFSRYWNKKDENHFFIQTCYIMLFAFAIHLRTVKIKIVTFVTSLSVSIIS